MAALYIGGMGAKGQNFYNALVSRYGYEAEAAEIQDLYLAGKKDEAAAKVPDELLELTNLCGPEGFMQERIAAFKEAGRQRAQRHAGRRRPGQARRAAQGLERLGPSAADRRTLAWTPVHARRRAPAAAAGPRVAGCAVRRRQGGTRRRGPCGTGGGCHCCRAEKVGATGRRQTTAGSARAGVAVVGGVVVAGGAVVVVAPPAAARVPPRNGPVTS